MGMAAAKWQTGRMTCARTDGSQNAHHFASSSSIGKTNRNTKKTERQSCSKRSHQVCHLPDQQMTSYA